MENGVTVGEAGAVTLVDVLGSIAANLGSRRDTTPLVTGSESAKGLIPGCCSFRVLP